MFKKLKDKIAEEVKQTSLKSVQQLAQAVVSPSSSSVFEPLSSNEKFCIEEADIEEDDSHAKVTSGGFTSVTLTGPISSLSNDQKHGFQSSTFTSPETEKFFPVFESQPTNYVVQSDWESASEVEDRYSQLEHINKESLFEAYRKVYNRYNKMKNKYQELVTHYRQLEREKDKVKAVLSETQDKALLRISELREQCLLEQQAKAHLEEALQNELEERDHIIKTLKTKVEYLKTNNNGALAESIHMNEFPEEETNSLIDHTNNQCVPNVPLPYAAFSSTENIDWSKKQLNDCEEFVINKSKQIEILKSKIQELKELNCDIDKISTEEDVCVEKCALQLKSKEEVFIIHQSLLSLINDLGNEESGLQQNAICYLPLKSARNPEEKQQKENLEENNSLVDITCLMDEHSQISGKENNIFTNLIDQYDGFSFDTLFKTNKKDACDLLNDELQRQCIVIKELEIQNELLNKKLNEQNVLAEQQQNQITFLNSIFTSTKTHLQKINKEFKEGNVNINNLSIVELPENDLIQELHYFVSNLLSTRSEMDVLAGFNLKLENDLTNIKVESRTTSKTEEASKIEKNNQNQIIASKEENVETEAYVDNIKSRDDCEDEINIRITHLQNLSFEINTLKGINQELQNQIKNLVHSTSVGTEKLKNIIEKLQYFSIDYTRENQFLQDKIDSLEIDLKKIKNYNSILVEKTDSFSNEIKSLNIENESNAKEKNILQNNIDQLENQLKQSKIEASLILEVKDSLLKQLTSLRKKCDDVIVEKDTFKTKVSNLQEDLVKCEQVCALAVKAKEQCSEELNMVRKAHELIVKDKNLVEDSLNILKVNLENNNKDYKTSVENVKQLSEELVALKNDLAELVKENTLLKNQIETLQSDYEKRKTEDLLAFQAKENVCDQLELLQNIQDDLKIENNVLKNKTEKLEEELKNSKQESLSLEKIKARLSEENYELKKECDNKSKENCLIKNTFDNVVEDFENCKKNYTLITESNLKLADDLALLRKEHNDIICVLSETKNCLECQQEISAELNKKLLDQSELLKEKSGKLEEMGKENMCLKTQAENMSRNINEVKCSEKATIEKLSLINDQLSKLNVVKNIREAQKNLYDFFVQFREEIFNELNNIKNKFQKDLLYQVQTILQDNEACKTITDLEYKSKKDMDSYQIKYLPADHLNVDQIVKYQSIPHKNIGHDEEKIFNNSVKYNETGNTLEIQQLIQEIKLKDDIINKLQYTVEYELERNDALTQTCLSKSIDVVGSKENLTPNSFQSGVNESSILLMSSNIGSENDKRYFVFEQENKALDHIENTACNLGGKKLEKAEKGTDCKLEILDIGKQHVNKYVNEQIENLREDEREEFEQLYEEHPHSVKEREEEIQQLRNSYEKDMRDQDKKWRSCLDRRLAEEEARHQEKVADLTRKWHYEKKELETASLLAASVAESGSGTSDMLLPQVQALAFQLQNNKCEVCDTKLPLCLPRTTKSIQDFTEMEYLRNILYEYMMGKEPLVLAKVLCALMKFDDSQTKDIVLKEEQKVTLLGQLGIL